MGALVNLLFAVLWSAVLFVVVHYAARRFFAVERERTIVATVAAVAYLLGAFVSPLRHNAPPGSTLGQTVVTSTPMSPPRDVSALCRTSKTGNVATNATGSFDGASDSFDRSAIANGSVVSAGHGLTLTGWAIANGGSAVAGGVCLDVDREITWAQVLYGIPRPDVAAGNKNAALEPSGFQITIPGDSLRPGKHVLRIIVIEPDGKRAVLSDARRLTVR